MDFKQWNTFNKGEWTHEIDVRDFIQKNYTPYTGDESFLSGATEKTLKLWNKVLKLYEKEKEKAKNLSQFEKYLEHSTSLSKPIPPITKKDL